MGKYYFLKSSRCKKYLDEFSGFRYQECHCEPEGRSNLNSSSNGIASSLSLLAMTHYMEMELSKSFKFEAAHRLPNFPEGHKCRRLHGHSYQVDVRIKGEISKNTGVVMDYQDITDAVAPIIRELDHYYLNEIKGLENPTSENLSKWIWERLKPTLPRLKVVIVRETCTSECSYFGP